MLILDIRVVLYGFLLLIIALVAVVWWWGTRPGRNAPLFRADVWEQAPVGVLLLAGQREYRWANTAARQMLGLDASHGVLPDADWVHILLSDREGARRAEQGSGRYRQADLGEGRVVRWWVTSTTKGDVMLLWDVTPYQRAAETAQVLLSTLAHELRNPLSTIRTHVEVLHLANVPADVRHQSLDILREEAARLSRLVDQMLELGRLDATPELDMRPTDVLSLVEHALASLQSRIEEKQLVLNLVSEAALPSVLADPDRIYQVFLNLLDNAITYCRPGDAITVILEARAEGVYCEVRDTGPGIPSAHLSQITRRFYRASNGQEGGSGLGLAIVEEILKRHGSTLHIESHTEGPERGTRVYFTLRKVT